jgi:MFS family permease
VLRIGCAATLPQITAVWGLSASQTGWIGGIYFAGYAVAVPFLSSATDHIDGRWLLTGSSWLGAAANLAFGFRADGLISASSLRFLGGVAIAGVHMPGLKMLTDRCAGSAQARGASFILRVMPQEMGYRSWLQAALTRGGVGRQHSSFAGLGRCCRFPWRGCALLQP